MTPCSFVVLWPTWLLLRTALLFICVCFLRQTRRLPILQGGTFALVTPAMAVLSMPEWKCPAWTQNASLVNTSSPAFIEEWQGRMRTVSQRQQFHSLTQKRRLRSWQFRIQCFLKIIHKPFCHVKTTKNVTVFIRSLSNGPTRNSEVVVLPLVLCKTSQVGLDRACLRSDFQV